MSIRRRYIRDTEDLTFIYYLSRGIVNRIEIYDNSLETKISLDEISKHAEAHYIAQLISFTKQKLQQNQSA